MSARPTHLVLTLLSLFALVSLSCGVSFKLPVDRIVTGPLRTDEISIPLPAGEEIDLTLKFGAGKFRLERGADGALVGGTARYNVADFKPEISTEGGVVTLKQGDFQVNGIPNFDGLKNEWDLQLGDTPMDLSINAGAYDGDFEFGGLSLTSLTIKDGAADVKVRFSEPNQAEMSLLRYETGASNVTLSDLGNANMASMNFSGGAGNYPLDFGGDLQREATISIDSGVSNVTLIIPENVNAKVSVDAGLTNISIPSGWSQSGNTYTQSGSGPMLTFVIKMGAGNLSITR